MKTFVYDKNFAQALVHEYAHHWRVFWANDGDLHSYMVQMDINDVDQAIHFVESGTIIVEKKINLN